MQKHPDKDAFYSDCLIGKDERPLRIIVTGQVFQELQESSVTFGDIVDAAVEIALDEGRAGEVVVTTEENELLRKITLKLQRANN